MTVYLDDGGEFAEWVAHLLTVGRASGIAPRTLGAPAGLTRDAARKHQATEQPRPGGLPIHDEMGALLADLDQAAVTKTNGGGRHE